MLDILGHAGAQAFLAVLLRVGGRQSPTVDAKTGAISFHYGHLTRVLLATPILVLLSLFAIFAVLVPPPHHGDLVYADVLAGFVLTVALARGWQTMRFAVLVFEDGLLCHSPWRCKRFVSWGEITELSYNRSGFSFIVHASDRWTFKVPIWVSGISRFLEYCEQDLAATVFTRANLGYSELGRQLP
jgi:hypothetical protein